MSGGVLRVSSNARRLDTVIEGVRGGIDGLLPGQSPSINLSGVWRGTPLTVIASLADPLLTAAGVPGAFSAAILSPVAGLTLTGGLAGGARFSFSGDFSASAPSLAALAHFLDSSPPPFLVADNVQLAGKVSATQTGVTFDEVTATAAGQTVRGAVQVSRLGMTPNISATLDSENIAVAALFGSLSPLLGSNGAWSEVPFSGAPPRSFDLDLRLSARRLDVYGHELADVAASAILKDGVLSASLVDGAVYGGRIKSEMRLACVDQNLQLDLRGKLTDADFSAVFADFGWPGQAGKGSAAFAFRTTGATPAKAIAELGGSATLKLEHGRIEGVNLEQALRRSQRRPIDTARDLLVGETGFDQLSLELALGKGIAHVANGDLQAQGVAADLQGAIDLAARNWKLRFNTVQIGAAGDWPPIWASTSRGHGKTRRSARPNRLMLRPPPRFPHRSCLREKQRGFSTAPVEAGKA